MEILFWIAVLTWMAKRSAEDVLHAVKGTPNPRYELKKAKAAAAGQPAPRQPRYGGREWFADLLSDAMVANTEKRRAKAKAKALPVDDMVDVVREAKKPAPAPAFRHETPEPPIPAQREEKPVPSGPEPSADGREAALRRLQETASRTLAEWDPEMWKRTHRRDNVTADDVIAGLAGPGGLFNGTAACSLCGRLFDPTTGRQSCACRTAPTDNRPDARIYQFPNPKHAEKEITMATSEVTGLSTAIAFAEHASQAHASFATAGTEGYTAALAQHGMGDGPISLAREAQEASQLAAEKWQAHADALKDQMNVKEAYQSQPDAANKEFLLNG